MRIPNPASLLIPLELGLVLSTVVLILLGGRVLLNALSKLDGTLAPGLRNIYGITSFCFSAHKSSRNPHIYDA